MPQGTARKFPTVVNKEIVANIAEGKKGKNISEYDLRKKDRQKESPTLKKANVDYHASRHHRGETRGGRGLSHQRIFLVHLDKILHHVS